MTDKPDQTQRILIIALAGCGCLALLGLLVLLGLLFGFGLFLSIPLVF